MLSLHSQDSICNNAFAVISQKASVEPSLFHLHYSQALFLAPSHHLQITALVFGVILFVAQLISSMGGVDCYPAGCLQWYGWPDGGEGLGHDKPYTENHGPTIRMDFFFNGPNDTGNKRVMTGMAVMYESGLIIHRGQTWSNSEADHYFYEFKKGEYITRIKIASGSLINGLQIYTNLGGQSAYIGNEGDGTLMDITMLAGKTLQFIKSNTGEYLYAVRLVIDDIGEPNTTIDNFRF